MSLRIGYESRICLACASQVMGLAPFKYAGLSCRAIYRRVDETALFKEKNRDRAEEEKVHAEVHEAELLDFVDFGERVHLSIQLRYELAGHFRSFS